jgi:copper(I)-binding protein
MSTSLVPNHRRLAATGLAAVLALGLAACGDDDTTTDDDAGEANAAQLTVDDVWARTSAAGQTAGAAYMVITGGPEGDSLVGASVDESIACATEVHETVPLAEVEAEGDDAADMGEDMGGGDDCDTGMGEDMGEDMGGDATTTTVAGADAAAAEATTTTAGDEMGGGEDDGGMGEGEGDMGTMTMRAVESIEVAAGEDVTLEPGGYHVMLLGLVEPLATGDTFDIDLEFENAGTVTVTAEVRES